MLLQPHRTKFICDVERQIEGKHALAIDAKIVVECLKQLKAHVTIKEVHDTISCVNGNPAMLLAGFPNNHADASSAISCSVASKRASNFAWAIFSASSRAISSLFFFS